MTDPTARPRHHAAAVNRLDDAHDFPRDEGGGPGEAFTLAYSIAHGVLAVEEAVRDLIVAVSSQGRPAPVYYGVDVTPDPARVMLAEFADDDTPCIDDHHGYCQQHVGGMASGGCLTRRARILLGLPVTP